jgi:hypothetical protein
VLNNALKILMLLFLIILYACTPSDLQYNAQPSPIFDVNNFYQKAKQSGKSVYKIDAHQSQVIIYVYKAGALAKLGHDHVIASYNLSGYILDDSNQAQADITVPLALLVVDETNLRKQAGFTSEPSSADIEGTKQHMLDSVLQATQYPLVHIHVNKLIENSPNAIAQVELTLHGVTRMVEVPIVIQKTTDNQLIVSGTFSLNQTDFNIKPYSVMGGLLQVEDKIDLKFNIIAK